MKAKNQGLFYGWYVLASSAVILFFVQGARTIIGVVFKPVVQEFSWNRSALSLAAFVNMAVFALTLTVVGRLYDRYGAKWVIICATLFLTAGLIGTACIQSLWQLILFYGIITAIGFGGTSIPLFATIASKWFHRHRGLAVSLTLAGGCLGQYLLVPAATHFVIAYGWRAAYALIASIILVVNFLLTLLCVKNTPESLHLMAYGAGDQNPGRQVTAAVSYPSEDLNLKEAMGTKSFWFYLIVMWVCGGGDYLFLTHLVPMVTDYGISAIAAGNMLGWAGLCSLAGVVLTGPITDRFGNKAPVVITFMLRAAIFIIILKFKTLLSFYTFAVLFGFTILITAPVTTTLMVKLYGFTHLGLITGFITTVHHFSGGLWAWAAGVDYDRTGSYDVSFCLAAAAAAVAVLCGLLIREEKHARR
jgi:MFS family permease